MGSPGPAPDVTLEDALQVFAQSDRPSTPLTATEVAEELECTRRTAHRKLEELAERGEIHSKKTGARSRVWWRPTDADGSAGRAVEEQSELEQLGAFVSAVEDYAIFALDPDGNVVSWNEGARRIKGYAEAEILGEHYSVFYPDAAIEDGVPGGNLDEAAAEGRVEDEGWRVRADGSRFWADVVITAIRGDDGALKGFTKVTRDRTEQREYEQQLRRERNLTEQILETVPVGITVLGPDGEFVRTNSRALERLSIERSDLGEYTADSLDLFDGEGAPIPADERPWARVAETGESVHDFQCQADLPEIGRRWLSIDAAPLAGDEGEGARIVFSMDDVTNLKTHERALERRKAELETELSEVLGRISDAFYALDEEWRFTHVNERSEDLLQHSREELIGERFWEVFPDATETAVWDEFHAAMDAQQPVSFETWYDAFGAWVEINAYPSETGLSVYFQDVTERVERERELERYRTIVETVDDGIYTVDPDGTFTMVNDAYAEMTGYSPGELVGSDASLVIDDETAESAQTLEEDLIAGERERVMIEADLRTADGGRVPAEATFALLPAEETGHERVGVVRDVGERKAQQRALERSERRYRTLVEHFPDGAVGLFDENLEYTAVGGQMLDEVGVAPEDRVGASVHDIYPDELVEEVEPYFRAALAGAETTFEAEFHGRHLLGHTLPVRDAADEVFAGMLVVQDVTERREMERELRESEAKFRMLAENLEEIVWMTTPDAEEFVYLNPAFEEVWGLDRDVLYDDSLAFLDVVHEDDRDRVRERFAELPDADFEEEFRIVRPDGEERWVYARGTRVTDGEMTRIVGIGEDVTERKEQEHELERALDLLERTERIADVGGWEIDPETNEVFWTDHIFDLLAVSSEEEPPLDEALDMYHEEDQPVVRAAVGDALESGESFDAEVRVRTDGGGVRWLRLQGVPETDAGDVVSFRGAAQDITDRIERERALQRANERLEASNERLEQFAYAASHDLQEPLRMVSSYLQLVEQRYTDDLDADGREFIEYAVGGADRMRNMIEGLLQYSRVETQGDPLEPVALDGVLETVRNDLRMRIEETHAEVTAEPLPRVEGDRSQLRQVVQNLLDNAIEYSGDEPPRVHVSAARNGPDGDEWVISVRDEGIGVDPDDADSIFEVFQRGHSTGDRGGTGIGLALCERIVERHGGEIWVESEPDEGSTFSFTLSAVEGDSDHGGRTEREERTDSGGPTDE